MYLICCVEITESKNLENRTCVAATKIMISAKSKDNLFELSTIFNCRHQEVVTTNKEDHIYIHQCTKEKKKQRKKKELLISIQISSFFPFPDDNN